MCVFGSEVKKKVFSMIKRIMALFLILSFLSRILANEFSMSILTMVGGIDIGRVGVCGDKGIIY